VLFSSNPKGDNEEGLSENRSGITMMRELSACCTPGSISTEASAKGLPAVYPAPSSLIRPNITLMARFISLLGRQKFPVKRHRELLCKPLVLRPIWTV
jgi:hypothetical protein